jgi:glyoxylase-like metal-dependent hydrolase (beta-lactamase superfamily II)
LEHFDDWTSHGAFQVAKGVYRIPLPLPTDGLRAVNVYAIEDEQTLVLVDAGWALAESHECLEKALKSIDRSLNDITRFLITHIHRDHYTQAVVIRREFGARVSLGVGERPALEDLNRPRKRSLTDQFRRLHMCGAGLLVQRLRDAGFDYEIDSTEWEQPDDWLIGSPTLQLGSRKLLAVPTPGHTQGHVVFADLEDRLLFAGDHVLPHITPSIGFENMPSSLPLGDFLESLSAVRQMPDMRLLPAHGPVMESVHQRVDELIVHHKIRLDACMNAVAAGASTAYETARALLWTRRGKRFSDLDLFNQMLATTETGAHLDLLVARGSLRLSIDDEVGHYDATI